MLKLKRRIAKILSPRPNRLPALDGRVFLIGSAPQNAPPSPEVDWRFVTVNGSQAVLRGWTPAKPTLTLFGRSWMGLTPANLSTREVLRGGETNHLVCVGHRREFWYYRRTARELGYRYDDLNMLTPALRVEVMARYLGEKFDAPEKPSNGVILALLCLHLGAKDVTISGVSLTQHGHAYNDQSLHRMHMIADRLALKIFKATDLPIFTNDPVLAEESGLPLRTK